MRPNVFILMIAVLSSAACWNPFTPSEYYGQFSFTVDGQSIQSSDKGRGALRGGDTISLTGADCGAGASLSILIRPAPAVGTFTAASGVSATYTPDARTSTSAGTNFAADYSRGSGSVTITSISGNKVAGSFSFTMVGGPGSPNAGTRVVQGTFDLEIADKTIC